MIMRLRGFTLTDCSTALFVAGLLLGAIMTPLQTQLEAGKFEVTQQRLDEAHQALLGYVAVHGYFPCPADGASKGHEPAGTDHASGSCPTYYGFLPAAELGVTTTDSGGYAPDGWNRDQNRIRYAVSNQALGSPANSNALTRSNGMRTAGIAYLSDPALSLFHVCGSGTGVAATTCGAAPTLVSTAPVVIWSVGPNAPTGGTSIDEAQNPNPNGGSPDRVFVSRVRGMVAGNEYDDVVTWLPMTVVITRMVAAGHLP